MIRKECLSTPVLLRPPTRGPVSHAAVLTRWLRPGSLGQRAVPSVARDNPAAGNDVSVTPTFRQAVRAGERGTGVHVPGPPCNRSRGHERAVRWVGAADVRCAGYGVRIPRPSPGVRVPASDANSGSCVALAEVWRTLRPPQCPTSRPCARACSRPALIAVPAGRRSAVAALYGMCGEITYSYRQLQTPGRVRRLRKRSFGHGIRAPVP